MLKKTYRTTILALVTLGACANAQAGWTTVYSNDFESGLSGQISGAGMLAPVSGYAGLGSSGNQFSGSYLVNDTGSMWHQTRPAPGTATTLTLTGLPGHTAISLSFLLAIRDSWDGSYYAPNPNLDLANYDYFNVAIDGNKVFSETFGFRTPTQYPGYVQSYVAPVGGLLTSGYGTNLGGNFGYPDSAYDMGKDPLFQSIAHTGSSLTISFWADGAGWQGGLDESWGLDNLRVSLLETETPPSPPPTTTPTPAPNPLPVPGTLLLTATALLGLGLSRRISAR